MKNASCRAAGLVLTTALLISAVLPSGCTSSAVKDAGDIEKLAAEFIEAVGTGDEDNWKDLIDGDISDTVEELKYPDISFKLASQITLDEVESVDVDRENNKAKARFRISYIDMNEFADVYIGGSIMCESDYLSSIDSFDSRDKMNLTMNFVLDETTGTWLIKKTSAEKYFDIISQTYMLSIAPISENAFCELITEVFEDFAEGSFETPYFTLDTDEIRVFDDFASDEQILADAAEEFAKAYFTYITDHGLIFENIEYYYVYSAEVRGTAPSHYEILEYISTDEVVINYYMAQIRAENAPDDATADEIWMRMYADIYYALAEKIPMMSGEDYEVEMILDPTGYELMFYEDIDFFPITKSEVYAASLITDEQDQRCYETAVENLYLAGELTGEQYEEYLAATDDWGNVTGDYTDEEGHINWAGTENHENMAENVYEYVPDWSDGTMIYGESSVDIRGICMHYSKEPGWLNTAGYCVDEDGITVMVTFDHKFTKGTVLEYDWYINDDVYGDTQIVTVEENGQVTFEFTIPVTSIPIYGTVDFRLWEEGHSHVIAYVSLTQT